MSPHCDDEVKKAFANFLLLHFILRRVEEYGFPHALRMAIGTEEENRAVLDTLTAFMGANGASGR